MIFDKKYGVRDNDGESNSGGSTCENGIVFEAWGNEPEYDNESGKVGRDE